jgi:type VI secretion system protein VasJ
MAETLAEPEVSEFIQEYLEPIPGASPTGADAANDEEYFKLSMEFPKTVPDYKNWIELSDIILKEKSKDIKVASWLCFAFYRTEQLKGFKNGLELVYHLLKKFGSDMFPANPVHKSKAIQFLNTSRVTKLLERDEINKSNAETVKSIGELLKLITDECAKLLPGNEPVLQGLEGIIAAHIENADKALKPSPVPEKKPTPPPQQQPVFKEPSAPVRQESTAPVAASRPASEDEAVIQLRHTLTYFYEVIQNNETVERVPESFFAFGIARQLQWSSLVLPTAEEKVTNIEPPNDIIRNLLKDWHSQNKVDVLIPRIELEFIKDNSEFRYWLDAQRYLVTALERKGGDYSLSAGDIKYHLSRLVKRLPELQNLKFRGGEIPFADKETLNWLNDIGKSAAVSSGQSSAVSSVSLTPIVDPTYDDINKEYEEAVAELPKNFGESFEQMQQKLKAEDRMKGKFLRRLNIANLCYEAKQYNVAKVNLSELKVMIEELNLAEWEPALSTAVWQSLYLTNVQLLFAVENETIKNQIESEQVELFNKIAKHNGILAINLEQQKHKRRK